MDEITDQHSYILVGQFMKEWSIVEIGIDRVVAGALRLDSTQALVVSKSLQLRAKISLINAMISLLPKPDEDESIFKQVRRELDQLTKDRNAIVHSTFHASENRRQVHFFGANITDGQPDLLLHSWTRQDFYDRFKRMHDLLGELEELRKILRLSADIQGLAGVLSRAQHNIFTTELRTEEDNVS